MITVIGSLKGGSGKSTTAFNLAIWLKKQKFSTVVFDLDPQQTLSDAAEFRAEDAYEPTLEVLSPKTQIDKKLLEASKKYDEVLVDIGNSDMNAVKKAYSVADRIVVPVLPSQSDIWSLQRFLQQLKQFKTKRNLEIVTFINRADTHYGVSETKDTLNILRQLPDTHVVPKFLSQRLSFRRAFSEGLSVFELEPQGKAAAEFLFFSKALYKHRKK